nr:glycosyltransferase family 4 protein [uncultured Ruminococcus sp.]
MLMQKICRAIKDFRDSLRSLSSLKKYIKAKRNSRLIFCISHAMSRSGAPQVLLETARMLKENGYEVCIVSARQGAMTGEISDIDVFSCRFLEKTFMKLIVKADPYACIINTVIMYKWAKYLGDRNVGSVWWIHEAETYISQHYRSVPEAFSDCVKIFCVSEWSLRALNRYLPSLKAGVLYYGIDADERADAGVIPSAADGKLKMTVIGTISERKNQIAVVEAFNQLSDEIKEHCTLKFVGAENPQEAAYFDAFHKLIESNGSIEYIPHIKHDEIHSVYASSDLIICSSVDDPLPVVITEAMIYHKAFLTSDCTGQAYMVEDGVNGFCFSLKNTHELSDKIEMIYRSRECLEQVGNNGHRLFEQYFSKEAFKAKTIGIIDEIMNKG